MTEVLINLHIHIYTLAKLTANFIHIYILLMKIHMNTVHKQLNR